MPNLLLRPWLLVATLTSLAAIGIAAYADLRWLAGIASAGFAGSVAGAGLLLRQKFSALKPPATDATAANKLLALRQTTQLSTLSHAWTATALMLSYPLAGLRWLHGWEYGLAFAILAGVFFIYCSKLADPADPLAQTSAVETAGRFAGVQAFVVVALLAWILLSGKLATVRGDWAANNIFLAEGIAILALSLVLVSVHRALSRSETSN